MRIGIIGPGKIAERFAKACSQVEEVTVYAVASSKKERAEAFAEKHGIPCGLGSYQELLQMEEVDAVYISVINPLHYQTAKSCLEAGKAVLCEKPMCMNPEQTRDLIETAKRHKVLLMEGMWTATLPCIHQTKKWIDEGRIGTISYMDSCFSFFCEPEQNKRLFLAELGGGGLLDVGIYCLAFSMLMMGQRPVSVKASLQMGDGGVDEMGAALLQFAGGAVANCVFGVQGEAVSDAHIYGSSGQIRLKDFYGCRRTELCDGWGKVLEVLEDPKEEGFVHEIQAFYEAWKEGRLEAAGATHQLSIACAELMEQVLRSGADNSGKSEQRCAEGQEHGL